MGKLNYKQTGVDIAKGDQISAQAFSELKRTFNSNSFLFKNLVGIKASFKNFKDPYLAFAADGVGTKLKYSFLSGNSKNAGVDVVAMCVNDLARNNITPLGFALYRATGVINQRQMQHIVEGVTQACLETDTVYVTGESAEMPDFYPKGEYDLAGFAVGVFEKDKLITGENVKVGDIVFGIASSGLHSNGFSLVRRIFPTEKLSKNSAILREVTMPTKLYVRSILETSSKFEISAWAHITGGGLFGKLAKIVPDGLSIELKEASWPIQTIFQEIATKGKISQKEMYSTFNMGLGFVGVARKENTDQIVDFLRKKGENVFVVGEVVTTTDKQKVKILS